MKKEKNTMLPIRKILFPTDFSEISHVALEAASELTLHFSSELILLHVVSFSSAIPRSPVLAGFDPPTVIKEMNYLARQSLERMVQEKEGEGINSRYMVMEGSPAHKIAHVAKEEDVDLIVISTHGLSGWRPFIFGSIAEKVMGLAPCAVLSIRISSVKTE